MKTKKRKKESRMHGRKMGTHGGGARKKRKGSGHRGGVGLSGSGKRADHKKTLITKIYGGKYFGKKGITSIGTKKDKGDRINIMTIDSNIQGLVKNGIAKQAKEGFELNLKGYKVLDSKDFVPKNKLIIYAKSASKNVIEKIRKSGGDIVFGKEKVKEEKKKTEEKVNKSSKTDK